jgi:hypothetical protein
MNNAIIGIIFLIGTQAQAATSAHRVARGCDPTWTPFTHVVSNDTFSISSPEGESTTTITAGQQGSVIGCNDFAILVSFDSKCKTEKCALPFLAWIGWSLGSEPRCFVADGTSQCQWFILAALSGNRIATYKSNGPDKVLSPNEYVPWPVLSSGNHSCFNEEARVKPHPHACMDTFISFTPSAN